MSQKPLKISQHHQTSSKPQGIQKAHKCLSFRTKQTDFLTLPLLCPALQLYCMHLSTAGSCCATLTLPIDKPMGLLSTAPTTTLWMEVISEGSRSLGKVHAGTMSPQTNKHLVDMPIKTACIFQKHKYLFGSGNRNVHTRNLTLLQGLYINK